MIGRTFDLEVRGVLSIESLDKDSETAPTLHTAGLSTKHDAGRAARND